MADYKDERLLTMAVPEDRPEIAALKNDITIPTALITQVPCLIPLASGHATYHLCQSSHEDGPGVIETA